MTVGAFAAIFRLPILLIAASTRIVAQVRKGCSENEYADIFLLAQ